jgi:hypothetical protein
MACWVISPAMDTGKAATHRDLLMMAQHVKRTERLFEDLATSVHPQLCLEKVWKPP